ncbi:MAG: PfkB family carbohydrate kinase [Actinomycetota bacterium]|nr:PfkB family carbohydrate kinase [Actinomycetota bacterium]
MSVTVVGSIAFDAVQTPHGGRERMLGGAAVHFALAASFFDEVRVVGPVGDDFGDDEYAVLHGRNVNTEDIEHVEGGKTFFWSGVYGRNMNSRDTLETDLNVFETFQPKLSDASRDCDVLFLANILPELQLEVRQQCENATFVALDSMDLWINIARDKLTAAIETVDCVILNDSEIELFTGEGEIVGGARKIIELGPSAVVVKLGKYGAALVTAEDSFWVPAFPVEFVADPTGAGDSFAGGLLGCIATALQAGEDITTQTMRVAMAYGTAVASYNVEEFGTERVAGLTADEIVERVRELQRITTFDAEKKLALT